MTVHLSSGEAAREILSFWFDEVGAARWFVKDAALDAEMAERFGEVRDHVLATEAQGWRDDPATRLAAILLLDQFSRNIHRGDPQAFDGDALARSLTYEALDVGEVALAPDEWRPFLLMPLMHSEQIDDQERSVAEFRKLRAPENLRFAIVHRDQIKRFGRFPGRNRALGRVSTPEEREVIERGETF